MLFGVTVGVSYRILYSIVSSLYVRCSVSIISVGEERANLSANLVTGSTLRKLLRIDSVISINLY